MGSGERAALGQKSGWAGALSWAASEGGLKRREEWRV
jgi:hypothetical protein